jgi:hypothetical protein
MRLPTFGREASWEHRALTGLTATQFADLLIELAATWELGGVRHEVQIPELTRD